MIAVCLLTCGRYEYTRRTLESFAAQNPDRSKFVLLHGDDASNDPALLDLVQQHGFLTVVQHRERLGNLALRRALIDAAAVYAPWTLILENDIESVRPFPWALFHYISKHKKIYCLRLFGAFKDAEKRQACKTTHQWRNAAPVEWKPLPNAPERSEITSIHWSAQPAVTRTSQLLALHRDNKRELGLTARVVENVMVHIGVQRTHELAEVAC